MSEIADRYRRVAATFSARVQEVPDDGWERRAPCEGWVARDVVRHLVEWVPAFFLAAGGPTLPSGTADHDPAGDWTALTDAIQTALDDAATAAATIAHPRAGTHRFDDAVDMFVTGDVLVHTWDLARATGLDETLDPDEVARQLAGMEPWDDALRSSGQYGPRVEVAEGADAQTRLIAFTGRQP